MVTKQSVLYCRWFIKWRCVAKLVQVKRRVELNRWSEKNTDLPANKRIILTGAQV
jgi:hypothetical protein